MIAACAPKRYHRTPRSLRASPSALSRSATAAGIRRPVELAFELDVVTQVRRAIRGGRPLGSDRVHVRSQRLCHLPWGVRTALAIELHPVGLPESSHRAA